MQDQGTPHAEETGAKRGRTLKPEKVVATLDFFHDGPAIRQVNLILDGGKTVVAYDAV
jgi:hypothetical protein